jgi:hypothetical protein
MSGFLFLHLVTAVAAPALSTALGRGGILPIKALMYVKPPLPLSCTQGRADMPKQVLTFNVHIDIHPVGPFGRVPHLVA